MFSDLKKILCVALVLFIIFLSPINAFAAVVTYRVSDFQAPTLYNSIGPNVDVLDNTVNIDALRNHLIDGFAECPEYVDISSFKIPYNATNQTAITSYIWYETPELFHVDQLGIGYNSTYITRVYASYRCTASEYKTMFSDFKKNADKLLEGVKGNNYLSDVEKALILHDRIAIWCEYDYERLENGTMPDISYSAYGVLVNQFAVCMGYALAYDYLLLQAGIDSYYCSSRLLNHAWNVVYINDTPYHVDITWDDPVYDKNGQVYHTNFLRSTNGISSTGHNSSGNIDYSTLPTDTTYDSYYWQASDTAFQLVNNELYYIDNDAKALKKINNNGETTVLKPLQYIWQADVGSFWGGHYSRLAFDGKNLLYSTPSAVYSYNIQTGASEIIFEPDLTAGIYYSIYGFKFENCTLICDVYNSPNYELTTKATNTKTLTHHVDSDWIIDNGPTTTQAGSKHKECINCGLVSQTGTIPAISVTAKTNSTINYENCYVFTNLFLCSNIFDLISVAGNTTANIAEANNVYFGTGTKINISNNGEEVSYLTLIVSGDINGDGVCNVLDANEAERFSTGAKEPTEIEIHAANGEYSTSVTPATYQALLNKVLSV